MRKLFSALILILLLPFPSCKKDFPDLDFKQEMRKFIMEISAYARAQNPSFIIIPQNGPELYTSNGLSTGDVVPDFFNSINGVGREDLNYGYDNDNKATKSDDNEYMLGFSIVAANHGKKVLVTDYCSDHSFIDNCFSVNSSNGFISFPSADRELRAIPTYPSTPENENATDIVNLDSAKNFLYLINTDIFTSKQDFIQQVAAKNYDVIIMDAFFNDELFSSSEINQLKHKANGGIRLVIAYMSIGEAEDYRWYWQKNWKRGNPDFIEKQNPQWKGNYKVRYWMTDWKNIIYGTADSYTQKLLNSGFDGAYLDIVDAFEYFEGN